MAVWPLLLLQNPVPEIVRADLSGGGREVASSPAADRLGGEFTALVRFRLDALPTGGRAALLTKRPEAWQPTPFSLGVTEGGQLQAQLSDGLQDQIVTGQPGVKVGTWHTGALAFRAGGEAVLYLDGREVARVPAPRDLEPTAHAWRLGRDDAWNVPFRGAFSLLAVYPRALDAAGVRAAADGTLAVRPATPEDVPDPRQWVEIHLTRYDQPLPARNARDGDISPIYHREPVRRPGPDALDWPSVTLDGRPILRSGPVEALPLPLRQGKAMRPLRRVASDAQIEPGDHWLRVGEWFWSRKNVYTTDPAMRGYGTRAELIGFPVRLDGPLKSVRVFHGEREVYRREEALDSLTLVLPAGEYRLEADGARGDLRVGPEPVAGPLPDERARPVAMKIGTVRVRNEALPDGFADGDAWRETLARLTTPFPAPAPVADRAPDPATGVATHGYWLPHGMSTGWWGNGAHGPAFSGTPEEYADLVAGMGFDALFSPVWFRGPEDREMERIVAALGARGVGFGASMESTNSPNQGLYAAALPEYGAPSLRDFALATQRLGRQPNFLGFCLGADNAGYTAYWEWAGPIMNRPFARSLEILGLADRPVGPRIKPNNDLERPSTQREFLDYAHRYAKTWNAFGAYAAEVAGVRPGTTFTSGSFGSAPGVGGRGGWSWASVPEREVFRGVPVVTAYDWNEARTSKPLHNLALTDRLRSEFPDRPCTSLVDDFGLFFGDGPRRRAYALAMTRGVAAIGTTFLPHKNLKPEKIAEYRRAFAEVHGLGGALRHASPDANLGILFLHDQAISRSVDEGSHEGQVVEAMVIAHAAGRPARVVTDAELRRGLPPKITHLLLVGLDRPDASWVWSDGLEPALKAFVARGGTVLRDEASVCPVPSVATGLRVAPYLTQSDDDPWPVLLRRNEANLDPLRRAVPPVGPATSDDPTLWAVPTTVDGVRYVAVLNWGIAPGRRPSDFAPARTGSLTWRTKGTIYDLKARRRVTPEEASRPEFGENEGVRWYAVTDAPALPPTLAMKAGRLAVGGTPGAPVRLEIGPRTFSVRGGGTYALPLAGKRSVAATEGLTGREVRATLVFPPLPAARPTGPDVASFLRRKDPLVLAVTDDQAGTPEIAALARALAKAGRSVRVRRIAPGDVVTGLQPIGGDHAFPRWRTIPSDLVLVGSPGDNALVRDLADGGVWRPSAAQVVVSPFVAGRRVLVLSGPRLGK